MSQNHRIPSSACAAFAPLLPLAGHDLLGEAEGARLRAHLAGCADCRAELAVYDQVELALRRSFAPRLGASPLFTREELMQTLDHNTDQPIDHPTPSAPIVPTATPRRARRFLVGLPALAAMLAIVVIAATLFAARGHKTPGTGSPNTTTPARGSQTWLTSISMVSPTEGWAIGHSEPANNANDSSVVLMRYTHGAWQPVHTALKGRINSISMDSATDGWAVGDEVTLHYDGQNWKQAPNGPQEILNQVQMLSPTDGWAVGLQSGGPNPAAVWHYDGHAWAAQPLLASLNLYIKDSLSLYSLSMVSPTEGWAAGTLIPPSPASYPTTAPSGVILHYTDGQWSIGDQISGATVQAVSMASADEGWAAGHTDTLTEITVDGQLASVDTTAPLLLHYAGGQWVKAPNPDYTGSQGDSFGNVFLASATDGWLTAGTDALSNTPILLRYNGAQWQQVSTPVIKGVRFYNIFDIAMTSAREGWAVGASTSTKEDGIPGPQGHGYQPTMTPVILHYLNGAWSVYQE